MAGKIATFIIPISPDHLEISKQAISSAEKQTVPCDVISYVDSERRGAGYARNRAIEQATTPFVICLDADDVAEPSYLQKTLAIYRRGFYVFTDAIVNGKPFRAPDCSPTSVWQTGAVHLVTCLIPTAFHRAAGGFDEGLSGFEDTAYFVRMHSLGMCGLRCPEPLLHYRSKLGERSQAFSRSGLYDSINHDLVKQYGRYKTVGCGCSGASAPQNGMTNTPNVGDVLCECNYAPTRKVGLFTQKQYPRAGFGERLWVHPNDVARSPQWWVIVSRPYEISPAIDEIMALVNS